MTSVSFLKKEEWLDNLAVKVFNGELILFFDGLAAAFTLDIAEAPKRNAEEANTEVSIRGPRDGFIDDLSVNVALVRKRLKTQSMAFEQYSLGNRSQTKAGLHYLKDIIRPEVVEDCRLPCREVFLYFRYRLNQDYPK
ncbi:hypothetical protein BK138_35585 [Paenibacillus rhizosphaerae]|uniref:Uncharacterized protein n=1 Tax=Paenibacillus rhizosphaerae TaxID=297318 RepID=A0A1R1DTT1_9BACL|nr:spore germination protein [Paenibacillus rhizosphaerae]OMF42946.1 hypothetical protein BK138_35585 [Paenibacillus rhizosphaerae]